jgi:glucose-1-phosphate adenylyltransferase
LIEHLRTTWMRGGLLPQHFITVVPPQMRLADTKEWYRGTADSVYQNINLIYDNKPDIVAIFGGDHIYRMDVRQMVDFHLKKKAKLTISVLPVHSKEAVQYGIASVDSNRQIKEFREKPLLSGRGEVLASMGNYIFNADTLIETLESMEKKPSSHDFGKDVIPFLVKKKAGVFAYDFSQNRIPMLKDHEEHFYWRDVGSIESYWHAHVDLLGKRPKLDLDNQAWPIHARNIDSPPAYTSDSDVSNSLVTAGSRILQAKVHNSIIGRSVIINAGCHIEDSIIMDFTIVEKDCRIKKTIIDRFNHIPPSVSIGFDKKSDAKKYYRDSSGITVIKRAPHSAVYW